MANSKAALTALFLISLSFSVTQRCVAFSAEDPNSRNVLVIIENEDIRSSHSIFFKSLSERGYTLDFKKASDKNLVFQKYGEFLYDAAIIFAPKLQGVDVSAVTDFIDAGHDVIIAGDKSPSDLIRDLASECGVDFDETSNNLVIDHINRVKAAIDSHNTLIPVSNIIESTTIVGSEPYANPILYRGAGLSVSTTTDLVLPVLSASASAFVGTPGSIPSKVPALLGKNIALVAATQARNDARVIISGSLEIFSDEFFEQTVEFNGKTVPSGNKQFADEVSKWVFHERGHIKAGELKHHKVNKTEEPSIYRIGDRLEVSVDILEWSGKEWVPYKADDVQVQFYMMSPYVLKALSHNYKGTFSTEIHVPDVYGVFQFKVKYKRLGYTTLSLAKQIPVRPYRHDEYERFIPAAFPYYASTFSMMFGFFLFGFVFLYHK